MRAAARPRADDRQRRSRGEVERRSGRLRPAAGGPFGTFGPASEEPYRRRPSDYTRLVAAVVIIVGTCLHEGDVTNTEQDVFSFFNRLPDSLQSWVDLTYRLGALWAVVLVAAAALVARRWRLARDLALSG